jgi:2-phosphosulfolactate phosphatase
LLHLQSLKERVVVLIDVFRATSVISTALGEAVERIIPVKDLQSALDLRGSATLVAGERNGEKVPEADLGNSPVTFLKKAYQGYRVVLTTSNGTKALQQAANEGATIWIGSFLNAHSLIYELKHIQQEVVLLCAGRHGYISLEDSMLAGYLLWHLPNHHQIGSDAALSLTALFEAHQSDWQSYTMNGTHAQYLQQQGKGDDIEHSLQIGLYQEIPVFKNGQITWQDDN